MMKFSKKLLSFLLIISIFALMASSCGNKGDILAVYNNNPVYESDVRDIINYQVILNATLEMTDEEKSEIAKEAVRTYVKYKVLEIDLKKKGYTIDEKALKQDVKDAIAYLDENFEGGYKDWRNMYHLSKNFLKEDLRRYALANLFNEYAKDTIEVSEEEMKNYYNVNAAQYADPAGYTWTAILREVLDFNDAEECETAIAEMESYIRQVSSGFMTMAQVKEDLMKKYTEEDGYTQTKLYSGENFSAKSDVNQVVDLNKSLAALKEKYKDVNPDADPETDKEAYQTYMRYLGECFQVEVYAALQNLKIGEVYSKPLKSFGGYYIIRLDKIKTENGFKPFDEVKSEIKKDIFENKMTTAFADYMTHLENDYGVQYLFDLPQTHS